MSFLENEARISIVLSIWKFWLLKLPKKESFQIYSPGREYFTQERRHERQSQRRCDESKGRKKSFQTKSGRQSELNLGKPENFSPGGNT